MTKFNHCVNHVAISVPNLDQAIQFYTQLFGFRALRPPMTTDRKDHPDGLTWKIYGKELNKVKLAIMTTGNGVGFEIFEFIDPPYSGTGRSTRFGPNDYTNDGFFHVAITVPDVIATFKEAESLGARIVGEVTYPAPGETCIYMQDPWGNVVELLSCSFEQLIANGVAA